jgi:hypothetical protein
MIDQVKQAEPRLRIGRKGKIMWGVPGRVAALPFRMTRYGLSFPVKAGWMPQRFAIVSFEDLQELHKTWLDDHLNG